MTNFDFDLDVHIYQFSFEYSVDFCNTRKAHAVYSLISKVVESALWQMQESATPIGAPITAASDEIEMTVRTNVFKISMIICSENEIGHRIVFSYKIIIFLPEILLRSITAARS